MWRPLSVVVLSLFAAFVMLVPGLALAQDGLEGDADLLVETKMQLTSLAELDGSGSIKITFKGEAAIELRQHILWEFDSSMNQVLEAQEVLDFLTSVASNLEGQPYWGVSLAPTTDFTNMSLEDASVETTGLVSTGPGSDADLSFWMDYDCGGQGFSKVIFVTKTAANTVCGAVRQSTGYSFDGIMRTEQRVVMFGFGSFIAPEMENGTLQAVRTPAGVVVWHASEFAVEDSVSTGDESISYESFSPIENHQVAFVILFICSMIIIRMPAHRFEKFRKLHPKRFRKYARPKLSVKAVAIALVVLVWTLYALPFLFAPMLDGYLLYSIYFILLGPLAVMVQYSVSRAVYDRSALDIPEDAVIEVKQALVEPETPEAVGFCTVCDRPIEFVQELGACETCGAEMHIECGERVQACPHCGSIINPEDTRSIQCKVCGESFLHAGKDDPYSIQCTRCGAFQEEVEAGNNYLVVDVDPTMAYRMMKAMGVSGRAAMVITAEFPGKMREAHELGEEVDLRWFSESTTDIDNVNPHDLEGDAMETASTFLMTTKRAGLMIDGMKMLVELNGFDKVLAYVRRLNDLAAIHGSSIIMHTDKEGLEEDQFKALSDEFDEVHDYL